MAKRKTFGVTKNGIKTPTVFAGGSIKSSVQTQQQPVQQTPAQQSAAERKRLGLTANKGTLTNLTGQQPVTPTGQVSDTGRFIQRDDSGKVIIDRPATQNELNSSSNVNAGFAPEVQFNQLSNELGFNSNTLLPTSEQDTKTTLQKRLEQSQANRRQQVALQNQNSQLQQEQIQLNATGQKGGLNAALAQGRGGITTSAREGALNQGLGTVNRQTEVALNNVKIGQSQRDEVTRQLDEAVRRNDQSIINQLQKKRDLVDLIIAKNQSIVDKAKQEQSNNAQNLLQTAQSNFDAQFSLDQLGSFTPTQTLQFANSFANTQGLGQDQKIGFLQFVLAKNSLAQQLKEAKTPQEQQGILGIAQQISQAGITGQNAQTVLQGQAQGLVGKPASEGGITQKAFDQLFGKKDNSSLQPTVSTSTNSDGSSNSFSITAGTGDAIPNALNNPGDLKTGGIADKFAKRDASGNLMLSGRGEGKFLTFDTPQDGFKALMADIGAKQKGNTRTGLTKDSTLGEFITSFANIAPTDSKFQEYQNNIASVVPNIDLPISQIPTDLLAKGVAKAEGFNGNINLDAQKQEPTFFSRLLDEGKTLGLTPEESRKRAIKLEIDSKKSLTESQGKAKAAVEVGIDEDARRQRIINESDKTEQEISQEITTIAKTLTDSEATFTSEAINKLGISVEARRIMISELAWLNAFLREESGAAISVGEFVTSGRANFPRAGDDPSTIKDKNERRIVKQNAVRSKVGIAGERLLQEEAAQRQKDSQSKLTTFDQTNTQDQASFASILDTISRLQQEGQSDTAIEQRLQDLGIDPTQFQ